MSLKEIVGYNIIKERKKQSFTQQKLANKADLSMTHLRNIEHGKTNATLDIIEKIANCLNVTLMDLLRGDIDGEDIKLSEFEAYHLTEKTIDVDDRKVTVYGIAGNGCEVNDITGNRDRALELLAICNNYKVHPLQVKDVVEDWLYENSLSGANNC